LKIKELTHFDKEEKKKKATIEAVALFFFET
jgi:hypothetical protein